MITGNELESPRGRIYLIRSALDGQLDWQRDVRPHTDLCLGCRACETACPSGVEYGSIIEMARVRLQEQKPRRSIQALTLGLTNRPAMQASVQLGRIFPKAKVPTFVAAALGAEGREAQLPRPQEPLKWPDLAVQDATEDVYFLTGCVMPVLYANVNDATRRLLQRVGLRIKPVDLGCCGALDQHAGFEKRAHAHIAGIEKNAIGDALIVTNSAGCGSWLKEIESLGGRTRDISEVLLERGLIEQLRLVSLPRNLRVTMHDACHLAHGQGIRSQPRDLVAAIPGCELVPLREVDTCCGSAGIYNILQPKMARTLLERKWANVEATGAEIVVTGNPGCLAWIEQAARERGKKIRVLHTAEFLERALSGNLL